MQPPIEIIVDDLILREFNHDDSASIYVFAKNNLNQLAKMQLGVSKPPSVEVLNTIASAAPGVVNFSIWLRSNMIGGVSYDCSKDSQRASLTFLTGEKYEGKGYMKLAVGALTNHLLNAGQVNEVYAQVPKIVR